jgi:hypothetical protein
MVLDTWNRINKGWRYALGRVSQISPRLFLNSDTWFMVYSNWFAISLMHEQQANMNILYKRKLINCISDFRFWLFEDLHKGSMYFIKSGRTRRHLSAKERPGSGTIAVATPTGLTSSDSLSSSGIAAYSDAALGQLTPLPRTSV